MTPDDGKMAMPATEQLRNYLSRIQETIAATDVQSVAQFADAVVETATSGNQVFFLGNGGSAATAAHYVNDIVMAFARAGRSVRTMSLTDNAAIVTGIANDYDFDEIFEFQLRALAGPGDLAVAISASGNSPNLVRAITFAKGSGIRTAGILGFDGGALRGMVDHCVHLPTAQGDYGPAEDAHLIVNHAVAELIRSRFTPS